MTARTRILLLLGNLLFVVALCLVVIPADWLPGLIQHASIPILACAVSLFVFKLIAVLRRVPKKAYRDRFSLGVVAVLVAAFGFQFVHEDFGYKILMDEYNLTATSMSMHMDRSVFTSTEGRYVRGEYNLSDGYIDKRPMLYPLLLSLVHDLTGYRIGNPHLLNVVLCGLLILVVYLAGFNIGKKGGGILSVLFLTGWPLLAQNATGAGFELLNLLLIALVLFLTLSYSERPGLEKETLLVLGAILLANVRYESFLFMVPVIFVVGVRWIAQRNLGPGWITLWSPLLLIPLLLQNRWFRTQENLWELGGQQKSVFSLDYLADNIGSAAVYFFNLGSEYPNSLLLSILGGLSLLFLLTVSAKRLRNWIAFRPKSFDILGLWGLTLIAHLCLILVYHIGKLDSHFATRLGMPIHLILVLAPVWLLIKEKLSTRAWTFMFCWAVFQIVVFSAPHSSQAVFTKKNFAEREFQWVRAQLQDADPRDFLIIDSRSTYWVCLKWQSLQLQYAGANRERIFERLRTGDLKDVYVVQRIAVDPSTVPNPVAEQVPGYSLETIDEYSSKPFTGVRLSRVRYP